MSKKINSYQKLKNRVKELEEEVASKNSDIRELALRPDSYMSLVLRYTCQIELEAENSLWFGDPTDNKADGIFSSIKE